MNKDKCPEFKVLGIGKLRIIMNKDNKALTPQQIVDKKNREIYIKKAKSLGMNVRMNSSDTTCKEEERKYYQSLPKQIGRPEAIRLFCRQCLGVTGRGEHFTEDLRDCPLRWGKPSDDGVHPTGCPFNMWRSGTKYQPKKAPKLTQKKAIEWMCKYCQQVAQCDHNVKNCPAFWGSGEEGKCPLHPFRRGSSSFTVKTESQMATIKKMREARGSKCLIK